MGAGNLERIRAAFDKVAPTFDSVLVRNPINAWMHEVNMNVVHRAFPPGSCLIELGCGSGTDAVDLACRGRKVFALDVSEGMVAQAQAKAALAGVQDRAIFVIGRSADLMDLVRNSRWVPFEGAYANFSLTYEGSLRTIAKALSTVLRPGAVFVCTLPNRIVLSEVLIYGGQLRFRKVLWRFTQPLLKDVHGEMLEIHAYSPWEVRNAFEDQFQLEGMIGLPTFLPPVYLHSQYRRLGKGQRLLQGLDRRLAARFPWNHLGEHTLYKFRRRSVRSQRED